MAGGRSETVAAIAVGIMCLLFGVPLWWKTTTTYRAALPYSDIEQIFQQEVCDQLWSISWRMGSE